MVVGILAAATFGVGWLIGTSDTPVEAASGSVQAVPTEDVVPASNRPARRSPAATQPAAKPVGPASKPPIEAPSPEQPLGSQPVVATKVDAGAAGVARIALVIDDLGRSVADVDRLERLGVPISYAVLPFEHSTELVVARLAGEEVLVHLPMAPVNGRDPGPGALVEGMSPVDLAAATRAAIERVPGAVGVNNHMGSGVTSDAEAMRAILGVVGARGLFFLDSRTTAQSVGYRLALELGIASAERQVFLDPDLSHAAIRTQFARLLEVATSRGAAIAIGHPHTSTLEVLEEQVPLARAAGFEFVPVSYLLDRTSVVDP